MNMITVIFFLFALPVFQSEPPFIDYPPKIETDMPLAIFISGDGGWKTFDKEICTILAEKGMPVAGLDAQKYFWNEKQPKETAAMISESASLYMQKWNKKGFVLVGYSFGAGIIPFIVSNLSPGSSGHLKGVFCLSPSETTDFEIHLSDMLSIKNNEEYDVISEIKKIRHFNTVAVFGSDEDSHVINHFSETGIRIEILPGSHHFEENYDALATKILNAFIQVK